MRAFVDKLENGKADLRLGETEQIQLVLPASVLPVGTREGDVLTLNFTRDETTMHADAREIDDQRKRLLERSKDEPL